MSDSECNDTCDNNRSSGQAEQEVGVTSAGLSSLLKNPGSLACRIDRDENLLPVALQLLLWGLVFHAAYGYAMALFSSPAAAIATAGKAPLIALCSLSLCLPSLYVFSGVAGMPVTVTQAFALAASAVAMTGLLLLGLTPVAWLFSVSTNSLPFVVIMNLVAWGIAAGFSLRFFASLAGTRKLTRTAGLKWWFFIYVVVTLQMATTLRPLLDKPEAGWRDPQKKFFLAHFKDSLNAPRKQTGQPVTPDRQAY